MSIHSDFKNIEKFHNQGWQLPTTESENNIKTLGRVEEINELKKKLESNSYGNIKKLHGFSFNLIKFARFIGLKRFDKSDLYNEEEKTVFSDLEKMVSKIKELKNHVLELKGFKNNEKVTNGLQMAISTLSEATKVIYNVRKSLEGTKIELCLEDSIDLGNTLNSLSRSVEEIANEHFLSGLEDLSFDEKEVISETINLNLPRESLSDLKYLIKGSSVLEKNSEVLERHQDLNDLRDLLLTIKVEANIEKVKMAIDRSVGKPICNEKQKKLIDELIKKNNLKSENCDYLKLIQLVNKELSVIIGLKKESEALAASNLIALRKLNKAINSIGDVEVKNQCIGKLKSIMQSQSKELRRDQLQKIFTQVYSNEKELMERLSSFHY